MGDTHILDGSVGHQPRTEDFADFHNSRDDDGMGLIGGGQQLKASSLRSLVYAKECELLQGRT